MTVRILDYSMKSCHFVTTYFFIIKILMCNYSLFTVYVQGSSAYGSSHIYFHVIYFCINYANVLSSKRGMYDSI